MRNKLHNQLQRISLLLSLCLLSNHLYGQNANSQFFDMMDGRFDVSGYLSENAYGFLPVPIIITDPAVDGGLGVIGIFFHETEEEKDKRLQAMQSTEEDAIDHLLPPSVTAAVVVGTGNESWLVGGGHMGFYDEGRIRYTGGGGYADINLDFFGSGDIELNSPVELNTKASVIMQTLSFQIADSPFFIGVTQNYIAAQISPVSLGNITSIFPPAFINELQNLLTVDVTTSALGVNLEFDTRDNLFSPTQGYNYQLEYLWYRDFIGSDIDFERLTLEGLNYWKPFKRWRAALRLETEYARSDSLLPPFATPMIDLRGIPGMRYQGNFVGIAEAELTWNIDSRWNVVGFAGAGRAVNQPSDFSEAPSRVTQGAGFRYLIARRYGLEVGMDIAWGPEDRVWYITTGSAWH